MKRTSYKTTGIFCLGRKENYVEAGHCSNERIRQRLRRVFEKGYGGGGSSDSGSIAAGIEEVRRVFDRIETIGRSEKGDFAPVVLETKERSAAVPLWLYRHGGEMFELAQSCRWDSGFYGFIVGSPEVRARALAEANAALSGEDSL